MPAVPSIDNAFVKQYEREVHEAYQRMGSKLRPTVRNKTNVKGATAVFQKVGKGEASEKTRNGLVPVMNLDHSTVECNLKDYYAGDWIDKLDELKLNHDERSVVANAGAYALGRKTDSLILDALKTTGITISAGGAGLTKAKALEGFEKLGDAEIPDDGERTAIIGFKQWSDLLGIPEFADADYVGDDDLPWKGAQAKRWLGTLWMPFTGLPKTGNTRKCFWYHKTAVAHASGLDVTSDITWHGDRAAHFVNNMMSQGACLIDGQAVIAIDCQE